MKHFEIVAREEESGVYKVKAGVGCVVLSIVWALAALLGAIGMLAKVVFQ